MWLARGYIRIRWIMVCLNSRMNCHCRHTPTASPSKTYTVTVAQIQASCLICSLPQVVSGVSAAVSGIQADRLFLASLTFCS